MIWLLISLGIQNIVFVSEAKQKPRVWYNNDISAADGKQN